MREQDHAIDHRVFFFFQAEDGIRYLVRSRGLGDVYKRQLLARVRSEAQRAGRGDSFYMFHLGYPEISARYNACLLYTSDAADERSSVDLGGRRIIKKQNKQYQFS